MSSKSKKVTPATGRHSFVTDFINFVKGFGVIGLALGVVIGTASTQIVSSLVTNIIEPIIAKIGGVEDIANLVWWDIKYGQFIADFIDFVILLFVVYVAVKVIIGRFLTPEEREKMGL